MLAYALSVGFVGAFIILAIIGHLLLLMAVWPNGLPDRDPTDAEREFAPAEPVAAHSPTLAA